jgi:hypothetical protein
MATLPPSEGTVEIELVDGTKHRGELFGVAPGEAGFRKLGEAIPRRLSLAELRAISVRDRPRGAWQGALIGGIGSALVGVGIGLIGGDKEDPCGRTCTPGDRAVTFGLVGLGAGALIGAAIGFAAGAHDRRVIEVVPPPAP